MQPEYEYSRWSGEITGEGFAFDLGNSRFSCSGFETLDELKDAIRSDNALITDSTLPE